MQETPKPANDDDPASRVRVIPCFERGVYLSQCFGVRPGQWSTVIETPMQDPLSRTTLQLHDALSALVLVLTAPLEPGDIADRQALLTELVADAHAILVRANGAHITPERATVQ